MVGEACIMTSEEQESSVLPWWRRFCRTLFTVLKYFWGSIFLSLLLGIISSALFLTKDTHFQDLIVGALWATFLAPHFLLLLTCFLALILVTVIARIGSAASAPPSALNERAEYRHRRILLEQLVKEYRDDLKRYLGNIAPIPLTIQEVSGITRFGRSSSQPSSSTSQSAVTKATVLEAYDQAGRGLLIIGEAGMGKTVLLYQLAQELLKRAIHDKEHPIPVVLNLSSWAKKRPPLQSWIIEELEQTYDISRSLSQSWMQKEGEERFLPLLDGLNEVAEVARPVCIEAINNYIREHQGQSLVVCSRTNKDEAHTVPESQRLRLQSAVEIQPLSLEQIIRYLNQERFRTSLNALRKVLQTNTAFKELLKMPLMLNVVIATYENKSSSSLPKSNTKRQLQQQIFKNYLQRKLPLNGKLRTTTPKQMLAGLIWLAKQMRDDSVSILYLERLPVDWLADQHLKMIYSLFAVFGVSFILGALINLVVNNIFGFSDYTYAIIYAVISGFIGVLMVQKRLTPRLTWHSAWRSLFFQGLLYGSCVALIVVFSYLLYIGPGYAVTDWLHDVFIYGSGFGLGMILLTMLSRFIILSDSLRITQVAPLGFLGLNRIKVGQLITGVLIGMILGVSAAVSDVLSSGLDHLWDNAPTDFFVFLLTTVILGIALEQETERDIGAIRPVEIIGFSWNSFWKTLVDPSHVRNSLLVGIGTLLVFLPTKGLNNGLVDSFQVNWHDGLTYSLEAALIYWSLLGFGVYIRMAGIFSPAKPHIFPNEGIRRSARSGFFIGLLAGWLSWLICVLCSTLGLGLANGSHAAESYGVIVGLAAGILFFLINGGIACFRHFTLRFLLVYSKTIPWFFLVSVLDEAADHILLYKVEGGYQFIHELFRDYLIDTDEAELLRE